MAGKSILKGGAKGAAKATKRTPNYVPVTLSPTRAGTSAPVHMGPTRRGPTPTSTRVPMPKPKYGPAMPSKAAGRGGARSGRPRGTGGTRTKSIPGSQGRAPTYGPSSPYYPNNPAPPGYGPPPKQPGFFAQHGKKTAAAVAGGAMIGGAIRNRTGKAVDPTTGLPKGMYGY